MKLSQYTMREVQITTTDAAGMRQRWMWGLRVLADPQMFNPGSSQLKPGTRESLTAAAAKRGIALSDSEINRRLSCARTYKTEEEFRRAVAEFSTWRDLANANFPPRTLEPPVGQEFTPEPPADWRTDAEKIHDRNRAYLDATNGMDAMFPLRDFEPVETTLADLELFMKDTDATHESIVAGHERTKAKRRAYLDSMEEAVGHDLTVTWQQAHDRLGGERPAAPA
jgi:hypothetical protein